MSGGARSLACAACSTTKAAVAGTVGTSAASVGPANGVGVRSTARQWSCIDAQPLSSGVSTMAVMSAGMLGISPAWCPAAIVAALLVIVGMTKACIPTKPKAISNATRARRARRVSDTGR